MEDKSVVVTKIWSDMFGEKNTKDEDNFFELGGDSIMALKMSEQLKQKGYTDRKSTRLNSSHRHTSRMPSSA